jgi:hypothetical protein
MISMPAPRRIAPAAIAWRLCSARPAREQVRDQHVADLRHAALVARHQQQERLGRVVLRRLDEAP